MGKCGAYLRFSVTINTTSDVRLLLDTTTQNGVTASACPTIGYRYETENSQIFNNYILVYSASQVNLNLATSLSPGTYTFYVYFRGRPINSIGTIWTGQNEVRINGVSVANDTTLNSYTPHSKRCVIYGDSHSIGTWVFGTADIIGNHDSWYSWVQSTMAALDCEYGLIGFNGQGYEKGLDFTDPSSTYPSLPIQLRPIRVGINIGQAVLVLRLQV